MKNIILIDEKTSDIIAASTVWSSTADPGQIVPIGYFCGWAWSLVSCLHHRIIITDFF